MMPTVLFVCEGNRARSQIAEGFFNAWAPPGWRGESAGTKPKESVHPAAIELMAAVGIDIARQRPKKLDLSLAARSWRVIAMCDIAACPVDVAEKTERWDVLDPADLPPERWHEIRDEIASRVKDLIAEIERGSG
jgi:protein-tyrosine-phosphatase